MASGTLTTNTSTDWVYVTDGRATVTLRGTFGGGTAQLEMLAENGSTALEIADGAWSAAGVAVIDMAGLPCKFRLTLAGATSPSLVWEIRAAAIGLA